MLIKLFGFVFLFIFLLIIIGIFILFRVVRTFLFGNKQSQYVYTNQSNQAKSDQQRQTAESQEKTTSYESYHGSKEWYASPERKKIFGDDEGEYIDFEEIKE